MEKSPQIYEVDDVALWIEQEESICLKAITDYGDPVELSLDEARRVADILLTLCSQLDS